jgi:alkylated DNA repair dioxygenase AlkB
LEDAWVVPTFMQEYLGLDPDPVFADLLRLPTIADEEQLRGRAAWLPGSNKALQMRGRKLARQKIWCQFVSDFEAGLYRDYAYTGRQWRVLPATCKVEAMPESFQRLAEELNRFYAEAFGRPFNHFIATKYNDGRDKIGQHQDKSAGFAPGSHFIVLKLGFPRPFTFSLGQDERPFFAESLSPGTAVVVRCNDPSGRDANSRVYHGVPQVREARVSGSIVARVIDATVSFDEVSRKIDTYNRRKRICLAERSQR